MEDGIVLPSRLPCRGSQNPESFARVLLSWVGERRCLSVSVLGSSFGSVGTKEPLNQSDYNFVWGERITY